MRSNIFAFVVFGFSATALYFVLKDRHYKKLSEAAIEKKNAAIKSGEFKLGQVVFLPIKR